MGFPNKGLGLPTSKINGFFVAKTYLFTVHLYLFAKYLLFVYDFLVSMYSSDSRYNTIAESISQRVSTCLGALVSSQIARCSSQVQPRPFIRQWSKQAATRLQSWARAKKQKYIHRVCHPKRCYGQSSSNLGLPTTEPMSREKIPTCDRKDRNPQRRITPVPRCTVR